MSTQNTPYIVSARKYRPTNFNQVVGQSALTTTLANAIGQGQLAHAYLFCGPRGVGKTTCARIFAKAINCTNPPAPGQACGTCESCQTFAQGRSLNIHELDAASNNSVDDIRSLIDQVSIPPQGGKYKVFIIDEVHMLSQQAFNAFLKTLEEPPAYVIFILATTEKHKILPTILSRCQIYDFNRMEVADIAGHLRHVAAQEGVTFEEEALNVIAQKADGGMRDALSLFDQLSSYTAGHITYQAVIEDLHILDYDYYFRTVDQLLAHDSTGLLLTLNDILRQGFAANHFIGGLADHLRDLLVSHDEQTLPLLETAQHVRERYREQASRCTPRFLQRALRLCNNCDLQYRQSRNKRLLVELTLLEAAEPDDEKPPAARLGKRLKPIFAALHANTTAPPSDSDTPPAAPPKDTKEEPKEPKRPETRQNLSLHTDAASPKTTAAHRMQTVSLRAHRATNRDTAAHQTAEHTAQYGNKPYTEHEVNYQWLRFANSLPIDHAATAGRMKAMKPVLGTEPGAIHITVETALVEKDMQALSPQITEHLRQHLDNAALHLVFHVAETETTVRRPYTPREKLAAMIQKNPALQQLCEQLDLQPA